MDGHRPPRGGHRIPLTGRLTVTGPPAGARHGVPLSRLGLRRATVSDVPEPTRTAPRTRSEAFGLLQVRRPYHGSAFEDENAVRSTAYNADYAWSVWRRCFEGEFTWLNGVERGTEYGSR